MIDGSCRGERYKAECIARRDTHRWATSGSITKRHPWRTDDLTCTRDSDMGDRVPNGMDDQVVAEQKDRGGLIG